MGQIIDMEDASFARLLKETRICRHGVDTDVTECEDCFWSHERAAAQAEYELNAEEEYDD